MDLGLVGKKVIIGGATRGISKATVEAFANEGAEIGMFSRNGAQLEELSQQLSVKGVRVESEKFSLTSREDYKAMLCRLATKLGGVDIFIHSISSSGSQATGDWDETYRIDLLGAVDGCEALKPFLEASSTASIILMSSTAAVETFLVPQAFNAIKASVITYAKQLSQAWAGSAIRVNAVSPGPVTFPGGNWDSIRAAMPELYDATVEQVALKRLGTPEDVARSIVFLASPAAEYITGINLIIDGGYTKRVQF